MAGEKCNLCDITPLEQTDRIIGENESAFAVYLGAEGAIGGCLIAPRRHEDNPCGLTNAEVLALHGLKTSLYEAMADHWQGVEVDEQYKGGIDMFGRPLMGEHLVIRMAPSLQNSSRYYSLRRPTLPSDRPTGRAFETMNLLRGYLLQPAD